MKTNYRPRINVVPTDEQYQIILGSLLGDGHLSSLTRTGHNNSHLRIVHSESQSDYIRWKQKQLLPFSYPVHSLHIEDKRGGSWKRHREVLYFNCASHDYFTQLRRTWYPNNKKVFDSSNVSCLNWLGLAIWFMDDGTYGWSKGSPYGFLSTEGFGIDVQPDIQDFIASTFEITCSIVKTGHGLKKIRISASGIRKLQKHLEPYIVPSMKYKLGCKGSSS